MCIRDSYAGHYLNIKSEIGPDPGPDPVNPPVEPEIDSDYELMAYSNTRIDYEYIINLIQNIVNPEDDGCLLYTSGWMVSHFLIQSLSR